MAETRRSRRLNRAAIALVVAGSVAAGCGRDEPDAAATGTIAVTTLPARLATMRDSISVSGTVAPQASAEFIVTAPEPAEIVELTRAEGDLVQAGDVLVRFEVPAIATEVATRQLELAEATTRVESARAEAARQTSLFEKGLTPRIQWEASRSALSIAETNLTQVRARFDAAKALEANMTVRARFAGLVAKRWHSAGDFVTGGVGDPVMRVIDPTKVQIAAAVPTTDSGRIMPGQTATVQTIAGTEAGIVALKTTPTGAGQPTVDVRINLLAPTTLPIDTPVQVDITVEERRDVVVVPADAVQRREGATFVWVPNESGQAMRRDVRLGLVANNLAQIVSGVAAGELVIVTGLAELTDGTPITISK